MINNSPLRLEFSDMRTPRTDLAEINTSLAKLGCRIWPLDFSSVDTEIQLMIEQPTLQDEEAELVKSHFLLSRQRLLEIINDAGRQPAVPGGGELMTYVPHDYFYPELYNAEQGVGADHWSGAMGNALYG